MRRLFPLLLILPMAACSSAGGEDPAPVAPAPTSAAASAAAPSPGRSGAAGGDAALSKDTKAICAQAERLTTQFGATFAQDLKQLIDSTTAENKAMRAEVEQKTQRDVQSFSFALGDLSRLASDADVKKALAGMSKEVTALNGDVKKLDADRLGELGDKLDKACGRG
jgi:hypothetical protein